MKRKPFFYKGLCIVGLALVLVVILLHSNGMLSKQIYIMLNGFSSAIFMVGLIFTIRSAIEASDPLIKKMNAIENKDERLLFIRRQTSAISGEIFQWLILAAALIFIGLGAPFWIGFSLIGLVILKLFMQFVFSIYYEDKY